MILPVEGIEPCESSILKIKEVSFLTVVDVFETVLGRVKVFVAVVVVVFDAGSTVLLTVFRTVVVVVVVPTFGAVEGETFGFKVAEVAPSREIGALKDSNMSMKYQMASS